MPIQQPVLERALDVVEVVGVPGVGHLDLGRVHPLLSEDRVYPRPGAALGVRVGHDRGGWSAARRARPRSGSSRRWESRPAHPPRT